MAQAFAYPLADDPAELGTLEMWDAALYADLQGCRAGRLSGAAFNAKHQYPAAILALDMTGFTHSSIHDGDLSSMLRILDVHRVCLPIFREHGAAKVRAFADDLSATFADPVHALRCAFDIHRRVDAFNALQPQEHHPAACCVGLGYGTVYRIGPDRAMGQEMNRTSKLGEDIAKGGETLVTEGFHQAVRHVPGFRYEPRSEGAGFAYYAAFLA